MREVELCHSFTSTFNDVANSVVVVREGDCLQVGGLLYCTAVVGLWRGVLYFSVTCRELRLDTRIRTFSFKSTCDIFLLFIHKLINMAY